MTFSCSGYPKLSPKINISKKDSVKQWIWDWIYKTYYSLHELLQQFTKTSVSLTSEFILCKFCRDPTLTLYLWYHIFVKTKKKTFWAFESIKIY